MLMDGAGSLVISAATSTDDSVRVEGRQLRRLWQRLSLPVTRDATEEWAYLVEDWQAKHDAVVGFPLYDGGMMRLDLLPEHEALVAAEKAAKAKMDAFIAAHP